MKIELLCPKCYRELKDKFSAGNCAIVVGGSHWLDVECLNCGEVLRVDLKASKLKDSADFCLNNSHRDKYYPDNIICPECGKEFNRNGD